MTKPQHTADLLFGFNLVAMVTPMQPDGAISERGLVRLVDHLMSTGCDGIVVGGTTGESPTLTDAEAAQLVRTVALRTKNQARVIAGIGTYDTAASVRRAREAEAAGADALLLVCPYYSKPTQAGVVAHCVAVADATELPVMLYDVPARTGIAMEAPTLIELAGHPRIRAVKDARAICSKRCPSWPVRRWPITAASTNSTYPISRAVPPAYSASSATLSPTATPS